MRNKKFFQGLGRVSKIQKKHKQKFWQNNLPQDKRLAMGIYRVALTKTKIYSSYLFRLSEGFKFDFFDIGFRYEVAVYAVIWSIICRIFILSK